MEPMTPCSCLIGKSLFIGKRLFDKVNVIKFLTN